MLISVTWSSPHDQFVIFPTGNKTKSFSFPIYSLPHVPVHNFISPSPGCSFFILHQRDVLAVMGWLENCSHAKTRLLDLFLLMPLQGRKETHCSFGKVSLIEARFLHSDPWSSVNFLNFSPSQSLILLCYRRLLHLFFLWNSHKEQSDISVVPCVSTEWTEFVSLPRCSWISKEWGIVLF